MGPGGQGIEPVGRNPLGLDGGDIDADDLALGVLIRKVDGPDTGTGTDIKHTMKLLVLQGSLVNLVVGEQTHGLMVDIETVFPTSADGNVHVRVPF